MEYLQDINDPLTKIDEEGIEYIDLFDYPELFYGTLNYTNSRLDLCKFPIETQKEMEKYGIGAVNEMKNLNSAACGVRLRFKTSSSRMIFKVKFKRKWGYLKMVNWGAFGLDVYKVVNGEYFHRTIFGPGNGYNIFAEIIFEEANSELCVFLPNYNSIEEFFLGLDKGSSIEKVDYPDENKLPVLFYGHSVTQGAAASRSGNSFPNYVSKMLNRDIINFSCSSCCHGNESMANLLGKINCHSIVIDYTRNAHNSKIFKQTHEKFYKKVRSYHPDTKIVLMTSASFNHWKDYYVFDEIVKETYENAIERGENTALLTYDDLFEENDLDLIAIDASHLNDFGMFKVAEKICDLIEK